MKMIMNIEKLSLHVFNVKILNVSWCKHWFTYKYSTAHYKQIVQHNTVWRRQ